MSVIPFGQPDDPTRPPSPGSTELAHEVLLPRFTSAADQLAAKAAMSGSGAEAKDYAKAALDCVTAIITLDPERLAGGDTPQGRKSATPDPARAETGKPATRDTDRDGKIGE